MKILPSFQGTRTGSVAPPLAAADAAAAGGGGGCDIPTLDDVRGGAATGALCADGTVAGICETYGDRRRILAC